MKGLMLTQAFVFALTVAATPSASRAMMAPWIYDEAIGEAAGRAVLRDLSVELDKENLLCEVEGAVLTALAGIGDFRRFADTEPPPPRPGGPPSLPAIGTRMSVTIPCFSSQTGGPPVGGYIYFSYEDLLNADEVTILLDQSGAYHPAETAGFRISKRKIVD